VEMPLKGDPKQMTAQHLKLGEKVLDKGPIG